MLSVMEIEMIPSTQRGMTKNSWLESRHFFSFGEYHNLRRLNFGTLRVFNDDIVQPGKGFGTHGHDNMEIVTIVLKGALRHKDLLGNETILKKGDVQRMSAGTGIEHSEYNNSSTQAVHFLQLWIYPKERDLTPSYEQKHFAAKQFKNILYPIVSSHPTTGSLSIHQNTTLFRADLDAGQVLSYTPEKRGRGVFFFVIEGEVLLVDKVLREGDAAQISHPEALQMKAFASSKLLLIEVDLFTL